MSVPQEYLAPVAPTDPMSPLSPGINYGLRPDGTQKGSGYFGMLSRADGGVSSEISVGVEINGKETDVPTLVPTLTPEERQWLLTNDVRDPSKIPPSIIQKARQYAEQRIKEGKSPFRQEGEPLTNTIGQTPMTPDPMNPMGGGSMGTNYEAQLKDQLAHPPPNPYTLPGASMEPVKEAFAQEQRDRAALNAAIPEQPAEGDPSQPPISMVDPIMKATAPLMLLIAAGGAFTKANGYAMMGALNGMVEGMNKGDAEGRARSWEQYQDAYAKWKDRVEESHRIHDEMLMALKGRVDADQAATEFAMKVRGDTIASGQYDTEQWKFGVEMLGKLQTAHEAMLSRMEVHNANERVKLLSLAAKETASMPRNEAGVTWIDRAAELAKGLIQTYKQQNPNVVPKTFGEVLTALSKDPRVGEFVQLTKDSKAVQIVIDMGGTSMRGNMFMMQVFSQTAPELWSMNAEQLATAVTTAQQLIHGVVDRQQKFMGEIQKQYSAAGGGDITVDAPRPYQPPTEPGGLIGGGGAGPPPEAVKQLQKGKLTHFANGQVWTLGDNGQPQQVQNAE